MEKKKMTPIRGDKPELLIRSRADVTIDLTDRIRIGAELHNRTVSSEYDYIKLHQDHVLWHDFNSELLRRAFDRADNQYYSDYTWSPGIRITRVGAGRETLSLKQRNQKIKEKIFEQVSRLRRIKEKLVLIDEDSSIDISKGSNEHRSDIDSLEHILLKFHRVAQSLKHRHNSRETLIIKDEYDVQDLLRGLLCLEFRDIREEEYTPSYAGGCSRVDFLLKESRIVLETKMTHDKLRDREIGQQLLVDIGKYQSHPDCELLVVFVYDKGDHIRNKIGMINDLEKLSTERIKIRVYIEPN